MSVRRLSRQHRSGDGKPPADLRIAVRIKTPGCDGSPLIRGRSDDGQAAQQAQDHQKENKMKLSDQGSRSGSMRLRSKR
jgi:hypothetical protein